MLQQRQPVSSVISRPWVLVRPGFEPSSSRSADRRLSIELTGRRLMTNSHELSRLSLDLWVVLVVVVVVATTCMRITRQFNREDERGQRWFNKYRNRSAPDWLYKNLLRTIRIKTHTHACGTRCVRRAAQGLSRWFFFKLCPIGRLNYLPIAFPTGLPA